MKKRPLILVTNDDGIHSPGLYAAASVAVKSGDVLIAAPHTQQTGMGRSFPGYPDNGVIEKIETEDMKLPGEITGNKILAYGIHGTPALAVAHGILELAEHTPDLCISGINYGENLGSCLTCSGTLGALLKHQVTESRGSQCLWKQSWRNSALRILRQKTGVPPSTFWKNIYGRH